MLRVGPWAAVAVLIAFFAIVPTPASAGTAEDPEIVDPMNDMTYLRTVPVTQPPAGVTVGLNSDILSVWLEDLGTDILVTIDIQGTGAATTTSSSVYTFHLESAGTAYEGTLKMGAASPVGNGAVSVGGVTAAGTSAAGVVTMTIPKDKIGSPTDGAVLTNLFAVASGRLVDQVADFTYDRAPNSGAGRDFVVGAGGAAVDANDTDGDGLNDTWETEQFGNLTAQNGTGDPDGDGLNNTAESELGTNATSADTDADGLDDGAEVELGTNATNPDTDGDGATDGEEVDAGTDPLDPNDFPAIDTGNETEGPDLGNGTLDQDADSSTGGDADGEGERTGLEGYLDSVKAETGYAGASAAGMAAVLLLSVVGLAGRWGL